MRIFPAMIIEFYITRQKSTRGQSERPGGGPEGGSLLQGGARQGHSERPDRKDNSIWVYVRCQLYVLQQRGTQTTS